jgi:hypothetical protein
MRQVDQLLGGGVAFTLILVTAAAQKKTAP